MAEPLDEDRPGTGPGDVAEPAYRSLYRRYRPQRFEQVKGQDHVTTALRNAVRDARVTHAYLFSGPRGTGKTSTARILARALNCQSLEDGEPCGRCDSCVSIAAGTSFDVHELDAASNNGVDAMRDLVARAVLATPGRWKIYIVDEVHMLSTAASNALLKTLEEPPEHVVFVLATTDPQKVLATIRSRTQHYEFHLLGEDVLALLLADVSEAAELDLPEGALISALRQGRGSARDALSALDQVAAGGIVADDEGVLGAIVSGLAGRDVARTLTALDAAISSGRDIQQLAADLVSRLRRGFLLLVAPGLGRVDDGALDSDEVESARELGTARSVRAMEVLGASIVTMRDAPEPRVALEVALVRLTHPDADDSPAGILERIERLERRLAGGAPGPAASSASPTAAPVAPPAVPPPPAAAPEGPRRALGAYREADRDDASSGSRPPPPASQVSPPPPPGVGPSPMSKAEGSHPSPAQPLAPAAARAEPPAVPSREELVGAWGDHVLVSLRAKVRAIYQAGRFVEGGDAEAVFALPNTAHLVHAEPLRTEVADALGRHFGRPVPLRLAADTSPVPEGAAGSKGAAGTSGSAGSVRPAGKARSAAVSPEPAVPVRRGADDDGGEDDDGTDPEGRPERAAPPPAGLTWAEDRLLRAFPGAEEV